MKDFAYSEQAALTKQVNQMLDPKRINKKPAMILESCDSAEHPESLPVIITFDVTGSNYQNAVIAQQLLPDLMDRLCKDITNPQIAVWANDDYETSGEACIQVSDFESDNRIDDAIRATWLVSLGGGNDHESYDLLLYCAARKTKLDSLDKRGKKGYMLMYADEPFTSKVSKRQVKDVFGDGIEKDIPIADIIKEVQDKYELFILWPHRGYAHARKQYIELVGADRVLTVQDPHHLIETIASTIISEEEKKKAELAEATSPNSDFYRENV